MDKLLTTPPADRAETMLNVLYIHGGRATPSPVETEERYFYKGQRPRLLYRLRLGSATLVTADPRVPAQVREVGCEVGLETIRVDA